MASLILRGRNYSIQWCEGGKVRRKSLSTESLQIAKEKLRQFESARYRGEDCPLPTRTPIGEVIAAYIEHMQAHRPERSWKRDLSYLREAFGECCPALRLVSAKSRRCRDKRCPEDQRRKLHPIGASCFEEITAAAISDMIAERVRIRGLAPKTANRYREVVCKVFNWAMDSSRVKMPSGKNPASKVQRYREHAPQIRFLTLTQIDEQLDALRFNPAMRAMVTTLIYAGLRREELLWLQVDDFDRSCRSAPNGLIRVRAKTVGGASWQPKTKVNRAVPVSRALRSVLERWSPPKSDHGWLFPSPNGTRWHPDNFSADLRAMNKAAGLVWSSLDYRHTFGSQLAQAGVSLLQIATLMGNSPEICRRHYAALVPETMAALVEFGTNRPNTISSPRKDAAM